MSLESLTVGIPALCDVDAALKKAEELRGSGFTGPIEISVNQSPPAESRFARKARELGTDMVLHASNLGLYGNFRWLLQRCSTEQFMWLAIDDEIPTNLLDYIREVGSSPSTVLITSAAKLVDSSGALPEKTVQIPLREDDPFRPHPTALFGVWNTLWLQKNFPERDFDWLDTFLLSRLIVGHEETLQLPTFRTFGNSNRDPKRVNGKYHSPTGWIHRSTRLLVRFGPLRRTLLASFFKASRNRLVFSLKELLQYLKKARLR